MRIGHGFDVHAFGKAAEGQVIMIGGVAIPFHRPLLAHSDGDVLLHALCDALLGAMALGDMGKHFPDTDPAYKNIDSRELLRKVFALLQANGFRLVNADITLIAQVPIMGPYIPGMVANIAGDLYCDTSQVNVKATTTEKLGFTGRGEGIACEAVVLIDRSR